MKLYVHARLRKEDAAALDRLRKSTGRSDSELVRRGLALILKEQSHVRSALDAAGNSVGKFKRGPKDLSTNKNRLDGFGE